MTSATHMKLHELAKKAAAYITNLLCESEAFEIEAAGLTAVIVYRAEIGEDAGDRWTAPSWWMLRETTTVKAVYDEEGNACNELAARLEEQLN